MSGRKVFTAGEVLQAADVNDFLMDQSVMVFAGTAARGSAIPSPTEGMVTYLEDSNQVQVYNGSSFGPIGTILQVVSTAKTDTFSTTSTSFVDVTGLTATITPSSASSKILIIASVSVATDAPSNTVRYRLSGGNSDTFVGDASSSRPRVLGYFRTTGDNDYRYHPFTVGLSYLDSPATTSATTYAVQLSIDSGVGYVNRSDLDFDGVGYGRSASSITVMEVAG